jgi:hypothetical protein
MMNKDALARSVTDWQRAPKDGSVINIEFPDGEVTRARYDVFQKQWAVPNHDGSLAWMGNVRNDLPLDWWPVF